MQQTSSLRNRAAASLIALGALLSGSLAVAQTPVRPGFNMFSAQQDAQIGQQMAASADRQLRTSQSAMVDRIGRRLVAATPGPKFNYRFRVVEQNDLNAFALPGGYVYVNRGILNAARSEGEVAGVIAHEIAHVSLRHGTANASKANLTQAGAGLLAQILGARTSSRGTAQAINIAGAVGLQAAMLKYTRSAETQADILGAQIMSRAGYSPYDMASFFKTLESQQRGRSMPTWLSSHPAPASRAKRVQQEAQLLGAAPPSQRYASRRSTARR
jgi:predicted Zn-dependent protease